MRAKKKILIIADYYLPGYKGGGPIKSISGVVGALSYQFDFYILTRDRDLGDAAPYPDIQKDSWQPVDKAHVWYASPDQLNPLKIRKILNSLEYDMLYINSFFSTLSIKVMWLRYLGLIPKCPVVMAPRGEFYGGALALKNWKKGPYVSLVRRLGIYNNIQWQASTPDETATVKDLFTNASVQTAIELPLHPLPPAPEVDFHYKQGITRLVFISRISPKKNLHMALKLLRDIKSPVEFHIYGPQQDAAYWAQCEALIKELPAHVQASYQGSLLPEDVVPTFARYHAFFFPTFGENYGYVIWEALFAGCPVIISDQTPWNNLFQHGIGWTLPLDEPEQFVAAIHEVTGRDTDDVREVAEKAQQYAISFAQDPAREEAHRQLFTSALNPG